MRLPWRWLTDKGRLKYHLLLAVDLERYSHLDAHQQLSAQTDLRRLIDGCAKRTGLRPNAWYRQPGGDGELIVLPDGVDIVRVVSAFAHALERALTELNGRRATRLRLRLAFHHGTMIEGPLGPAGQAPIVVSRLLDSAPLRAYLAEHTDRDLALVVSDSLFKDVIGSGFCDVDPADFIGLEVEIKEKTYRGYIYHADPVPVTG